MPPKLIFAETHEINGVSYGRDGSNQWYYYRTQENRWVSMQGRPDMPRSGPSRSNTAPSSVPRHDRSNSASLQDQIVAGTSRMSLLSNQTEANGSALPNQFNLAEIKRQSGYQVKLSDIAIRKGGELSRNNHEAHRKILPLPSSYDQLPPGYGQRKDPRKYFTFGKVFNAVWTEEAGKYSDITDGTGFSKARYSDVYQKTRFFVVVRPGDTSCTAIPITTYGGRGCGKKTLKNDHGIVYTGDYPPDPLPEELPIGNELAMQPIPIRVMPDHKTDKLLPKSRLNYFKFCTVEHSALVKHFGVVQDACRDSLREQTLNCWFRSDTRFRRTASTTSTTFIPRVQDETLEEQERRSRVQSHAGAVDLHSQQHQPYRQAQGYVATTGDRKARIEEIMRKRNCNRQQAEQLLIAIQNKLAAQNNQRQ